jgi:hypothetical protein
MPLRFLRCSQGGAAWSGTSSTSSSSSSVHGDGVGRDREGEEEETAADRGVARVRGEAAAVLLRGRRRRVRRPSGEASLHRAAQRSSAPSSVSVRGRRGETVPGPGGLVRWREEGGGSRARRRLDPSPPAYLFFFLLKGFSNFAF